MHLKGKTVLITGAAKRIGRAIALAFAGKGARVLVHYHESQREAAGLVRELHALGVPAWSYRADLGSLRDIRRMTGKIITEVGGADILVNNASVFYRTPFHKTSEKDWEAFLGVHVKAPFFLAQALAPVMKKKKAGRIINIADWSGLRPTKNYIPYCVSKGALITLTQALAKALAPEVLVTAIGPGPLLPPSDFTMRDKRMVARSTLMGRWGKPEDMARFVVFLAEQDFVTGSLHLVDGGESLRS